MILINLLPHREAARKRRKEAFNVTMALSLLAGLVVAGLIYAWFQYQLDRQSERNAYLKREVTVLEKQIKEVAGLEGEISALQARQKAVEDLQADRNLPVHLLTELVRQVPEGVYVNQLRQVDQTIDMKGVAQSNERVSEMLRNLSSNTPWLAQPELQEIVASMMALGPKEQRKVVNFNLRFRLLKTAEASKAEADAAARAATPAPGTPASKGGV